MWYVVQVPSGRESYMCQLIQRVAAERAERVSKNGIGGGSDGFRRRAFDEPTTDDAHALNECFVPLCEFERKRRGVWCKVQLPLFPGYVVVDSDHVERLEQLLRHVPEFTRLLRMGETFTPLDEAECAWIQMYADNVEHRVEMSVGVMEGDCVRVISGPLRGHEGQIKEIRRRAGIAVLEVHMFGRTMTAKVGLAIVAKRPEQQKSESRSDR